MTKSTAMTNKTFDVIIIGGSYSGLSAALALGRSLRKVLVIDGGKPCNRFTAHSHNFLTQDGQTPADIGLRAKENALKYKTVEFLEDFAVSAKKNEKIFFVQTAAGNEYSGRILIIATGLKDTMPDIKGFEDCWGKSIIHCPYCDGYEHAHETTSIIGNGEQAYHYAAMLLNWTKDLRLFTNGPSAMEAHHLTKLQQHGIDVIETAIEKIEHSDGHANSITTKDGRSFPAKVIYNKPHFVQHSDIPALLRCEITDTGLIKVDESQKTTVEGVFACGDNSVKFRSVAAAVYTGMYAGAMVNAELIKEDYMN